MARALDLRRVTLGALVVPALEIGIDDLVIPGDDSPTRLRFQAAAEATVVEPKYLPKRQWTLEAQLQDIALSQRKRWQRLD
jgi:hypothetical protein